MNLAIHMAQDTQVQPKESDALLDCNVEMWDTSPVYLDYGSSDYNTDTDKGTDADSVDEETIAVVVVSENTDSNNPSLCCTICNLLFDNVEEVNAHLDLPIHETSKKCQLCHKILDENSYKIHMELHKETNKRSKGKNKVQCKVCHKVVTKTYLKFHMTIHNDDNKLCRIKTCTICMKSIHINYLNDHIKKMHSLDTPTDTKLCEGKEKCPICSKSINNNDMEHHMTTHSQNNTSKPKPTVCDICGKVFRNRSSFYTHKLTHTGDLKYKCEFCPYRGLHLGLLKIHVRTHTMDYAYKCSICKKQFITKSNLSAHEKRHSPPEFNCSICNKAFFTGVKLKKHNDVIHLGKKEFKCNACGRTFGYKYGLYAHEKKVHNRLPVTTVGRLPSYLKQKEQS